jgi:hypothetical protein
MGESYWVVDKNERGEARQPSSTRRFSFMRFAPRPEPSGHSRVFDALALVQFFDSRLNFIQLPVLGLDIQPN